MFISGRFQTKKQTATSTKPHRQYQNKLSRSKPRCASINTIATDSVNVNLIIDKQKRLENLVFIKAAQQKTPQSSLESSNTPREKDVEDNH